jgi:hypothetical protein
VQSRRSQARILDAPGSTVLLVHGLGGGVRLGGARCNSDTPNPCINNQWLLMHGLGGFRFGGFRCNIGASGCKRVWAPPGPLIGNMMMMMMGPAGRDFGLRPGGGAPGREYQYASTLSMY